MLTELTISANKIGHVGVQHLVKGIMRNKKCKLTILDLSVNSLTDEGADAITPMLRTNTQLAKLCINGNKLTHKGASAIFDALSDSEESSALQELQCGFNPAIGDGAMAALARMLVRLQTLVGKRGPAVY